MSANERKTNAKLAKNHAFLQKRNAIHAFPETSWCKLQWGYTSGWRLFGAGEAGGSVVSGYKPQSLQNPVGNLVGKERLNGEAQLGQKVTAATLPAFAPLALL